MSWDPISFSVPGFAAVLTAAKSTADPWKMSIVEALSQNWPHGHLRSPVRIEMAFGLPAGRYRQTAIPNLLKSTIDGISNVLFYPSPSGQPGPWSREDWWVHELDAKKFVAEAPHVEVTISAAGETSTSMPGWSHAAFADNIVPGDAPPWPGDRAGLLRVADWRRRAITIFDTPGSHFAEVSGQFEFVTSARRMSWVDLDNLCIPAAQALAAIAFGDHRRTTEIVRIQASKRVVETAESEHTRFRIFGADSSSTQHSRVASVSRAQLVAFVPVTDTTRARAFYVDTLGLAFEREDGFAVVVRSGETRIRLVHIPGHAPQPFTTLGWEVDDVAAEVRAISARGVSFLRVDGMTQDELGIWSPPGGGQVAWFKDPDGNTLSVSGHG